MNGTESVDQFWGNQHLWEMEFPVNSIRSDSRHCDFYSKFVNVFSVAQNVVSMVNVHGTFGKMCVCSVEAVWRCQLNPAH